MAKLGGFELEEVSNEEIRKTAGLTSFPTPLADSTSALIFDFTGATREISISGRLKRATGETDATFRGRRDTLLGKLSGQQTATIAYISDLGTTFNVFVDDIRITFSEMDGPNIIKYQITLIEGTAP